jgi:omega-6 fatty acid desaturase (delta-12 desaturase)
MGPPFDGRAASSEGTASRERPGLVEGRRLRAVIAPFQGSVGWRSYTQLASSFVPFLLLEVALYASLGISYWLTLALAVPAAGFVVRIFIIQHDCGHGSFMATPAANALVGRLCSLVTMTPYDNWRRQHAGHHVVWNDLDHRDSGIDLYSTCITLEEYRALRPWARWRYRLMQNPLIALLLLPPLVFMVIYRLPFDTPRSWIKERLSVHFTNLALLLIVTGLAFWQGLGAVLLVQVPVMAFAAIVGVWLFSLQHRYENVHWSRRADWDATRAAIEGTSYLKLPWLLDWFTGHIGFHAMHHLNSRIPNYRLAGAHAALAAVATLPPPLLLGAALGASRYAVWDEANNRMIRFPKLMQADNA